MLGRIAFVLDTTLASMDLVSLCQPSFCRYRLIIS